MSLESVFKLSLIMNMIDNLSGPMANISSRVGESVSRLDALSARFGGMAKTGAAMTAMGSQIADAALAPVLLPQLLRPVERYVKSRFYKCGL